MSDEITGYVMATITITRVLTGDGEDIHQVFTDDGSDGEVSLVEALGMLSMAADSLLHGPDEDDE